MTYNDSLCLKEFGFDRVLFQGKTIYPSQVSIHQGHANKESRSVKRFMKSVNTQ